MIALLVLGVALTVGIVALTVLAVGAFRTGNEDWPFPAIMAGVGWACFLLVIGLMTLPSRPFIEGHCYEAVRHTSTTYIPVTTGKTTIIVPSTTEGIDLVDVPCR